MEKVKEEQNVVVINKTTRSDIFFVDPNLLKIVEGFNTRIDYGEIVELKKSIIENGVRIPLRGYKEGEFFFITDGHRRLMAVKLAAKDGVEIARVPFISERKKTIEERILDILLFNDGKQLTPLELGETYKRLMNYGHNYTEIATKIGKTIKHVSDMVSVANSSKEIKDIINSGDISATLVAEVKSLVKDTDKAETIIKNASNLKKELGGKTKVTKKDVAEMLPKKEIPVVYSLEDVKALLAQQIWECAKDLPDEFKAQVENTKMVV